MAGFGMTNNTSKSNNEERGDAGGVSPKSSSSAGSGNRNLDAETATKVRLLEKELFETRNAFALKQEELNDLQALLEKFLAPDEDVASLQEKFDSLLSQLESMDTSRRGHRAKKTKAEEEVARLKKQLELLQEEMAVKDQKLKALESNEPDDYSTSTPLLDALQYQAQKLLMAKESEKLPSGPGNSAKKKGKPSSLKRAVQAGASTPTAKETRSVDTIQQLQAQALAQLQEQATVSVSPASSIDKEEALQLKDKYLSLKTQFNQVEKEKASLARLLQEQEESQTQQDEIVNQLTKKLEEVLGTLKTVTEEKDELTAQVEKWKLQPPQASTPSTPSLQRLSAMAPPFQPKYSPPLQLSPDSDLLGRDTKTQLEAEIERLNDSLQKAGADQQRLQDQLETSQQRLQEVQQQLQEEQASQMSEVERERQQQRQAQISQLQEQAEEAAREHESQMSRMISLTGELREALQAAMAENEQLKAETMELGDRLQNAIGEKETLADELKSLRAVPGDSAARHPATPNTGDSDDDRFQTPRSSLGKLPKGTPEATSTQIIEQLEEENAQLHQQLAELKVQIQSSLQPISNLQATPNDSAAFAAFQERVESRVQTQIQAKTKEIEHLKGQIFTLQKQSAHKEKLLEKQGQELEDFKAGVRAQIQHGLEQNKNLQYQLATMHEAMEQKDALLRQQEEEYNTFQMTVGSQIQNLIRGGAGGGDVSSMDEQTTDDDLSSHLRRDNKQDEIAALLEEIAQKEESIVALQKQLGQKDRSIEENRSRNGQEIAAMQQQIAESQERILALQEQLAEKDLQIQEIARINENVVANFQQDVNEKEERIVALNQQVAEKYMQLEDSAQKGEQIEALQQELAEKEQSIVALHEQLAEKNLQLEDFEHLQATVELQIQSLVRGNGAEGGANAIENKKNHAEIASFQQELGDKNQRIADLQRELAQKSQKVEEYEVFQATAEMQIQNLVRGKGGVKRDKDANEEYARLHEKIAEKEQNILDLKKQLGKKDRKIKDLEALQATVELQIQSLVRGNGAVEGANAADKNKKNDAEIAFLQEELSEKEQSITDLHEELAKKNQQIEEYEAFQATAEMQIQNLVRSKGGLTRGENDKEADEENARLYEKIAEKEQKNLDLQAQLVKKNRQLEDFEALQATVELQIQNLVKGRIDGGNYGKETDVTDEIATLQEEVTEKKQAIVDLQGKLAEKEAMIKEQEKQFDSFQTTVQVQMLNLMKSGSDAVVANDDEKDQGGQQALLLALEEAKIHLRQQADKLKTCTQNASAQIQKKTEENELLRAQLNELQDQLELKKRALRLQEEGYESQKKRLSSRMSFLHDQLEEKEFLLEQSERLENSRRMACDAESVDNSRMSSLQQEVAALQESLAAKEQELQEQHLKLDTIGAKERALEQARKELEAEVKATAEENTRLVEELASLKLELAQQLEFQANEPDKDLQSVVAMLRKTIRLKEQELEEVRSKFQQELREKAEVNERLSRELAALREEAARSKELLQLEIASLRETIGSDAAVKTTRLVREIALLKEDIRQLEEKAVRPVSIDMLKQDIGERDEKIGKLKAKIDRLKQGGTVDGDAGLLSSPSGLPSQSLEDLHAKIEELKNIIRTNEEAKNVHIKVLKEAIQSKDRELEKMLEANNENERFVGLTAEIDKLKMEVYTKESEYNLEARRRVEEREATKAEIRQLTIELDSREAEVRRKAAESVKLENEVSEMKKLLASSGTVNPAIFSNELNFLARNVAKNMSSLVQGPHKVLAELVQSIVGDDVVTVNDALSQLTNLLNKERVGQEFRVDLFRSGAHLVIISTMKRYLGSADIQEEGCRAISAFALMNKKLSYAAVGGMGNICIGLAAAGAFESILAAMDAFPDDAKLSKRAFRALNNLISSKDLVPLFFDMSLFPLVCKHMTNFPDDPTIQEDSCRILRFTCAYPQAREAFKKDGALRIVAGVLERFDVDSVTYQQAYRTWNALLLGK